MNVLSVQVSIGQLDINLSGGARYCLDIYFYRFYNHKNNNNNNSSNNNNLHENNNNNNSTNSNNNNNNNIFYTSLGQRKVNTTNRALKKFVDFLIFNF